MRTLVVASVLAALRALASSAYAEPAVPNEPAAPNDLVARPLVLETGELEVRLSAEMNLLPRRFAKPLSLAPDAWYGITDRWTVGVIHSNQSVDRIDSVSTFCVRELEGQCERAYHGSGVDVMWSWRTGPLAIAPRARALLRGVDPLKPAITLGARVQWTRGGLGIASDPYLRIGLANRGRGNRAALYVPIWVGMQPVRRVMAGIHTGWDSELAVIRDGWRIPVGLFLRVRPVDGLELGIEAGYRALLGPQNNTAMSAAIFTVGWRGQIL